MPATEAAFCNATRLTLVGSMLIREFDESADKYFDDHIYNRKADALNEDRDIFNLADGK